ncbi:hypothetical protein FKM82_029319 [Ascaphus truei]
MHNFQKSHAKQSGNFGTTRNHSSRDRGRSEECSMYNPTRGNRDMNNSQQPSGELNNDLHSFLGGRGGGTFSRNPRSTVHGNHDIRARSENRARTGLRPDVHYTSSEPHRSSGSYSRQDQTNSTEKDRGHGDARAKTRERDDSRGKRGSYTQSQARASRDQSSGTRGLSQRHKSPGRYASQNMIAASGNKTRGMDHLSVFQQKKNTFGNRTQSLQNLLDVSTDYNGSERSNSHGFRGTTASNKGKGSHIVKKLNNLMITNLSMLEPSEIVMKLAAPGNGLKELLNESSIDFQLLESLLKVLNKAIGCKTNRQNLIHLLSHVQGSVFLKQVLPLHILASERTATHQNIEFIDHILVLLTEVVRIFPCSSFTEVTIGETLLLKAIHEMRTSGKIVPEEIQKKLTTLHTFLQHLQEKKQEGTLRSDNYVYKIGNQANIEDDDFQSISIFPTRKDIYLDQNPCMRPNIINGSYPDAKSYLDTHFRLLREDFIRPLRDGISQLLTLQTKELAKAKLDDIRIYFNTRILSPVCTRAGIVHEVQFSMRNLKQVTWEISRRLLYGALVCLSKDNFENMLFATVADRSLPDLQNGIITLMFTEESRQKLAEHTIDDTFLMVETMAYFEAYRHVLEGLKEMVDSEIPFQNYIVHCDTTMSAPVYLGQDRSGYSLEKLIKKSPTREKICSRGIKTSPERMLTLLRNRYSNEQVAQFDVLDFMTWPTKEELELDRSQFEAFQMALTSELSIVQGPPGTGKTYVGLKIVHSLLANSQIWKQGHSPILIVCYTNHALDQFLEGILKYSTCSMVRVGSRSSSEILQKFSLAKIRSNRSHVSLPGYMRAMNAELYGEKKNVEEMLNEKASGLQNAVRGILHENTLEKYILPRHFTCLISQKEYMETPGSSSRISSFIVEWLGVSVVYQSAQERRNYYHTQRELQLWEVESIMDENDSLDEFPAQEEEAEEDCIKVSEEAEQAEAERKFEEEDDIKKQIRIARERAARREREILAFLPDEQDDDDQDNDTDEGGWQIPKDMKKKLKKQIKHELQMTCHMTEEVEQIHDLWQLPMLKRWDLYRSWRSKYLTDIRLQIFDLENLYQVVVKRLNELRNQEDVLILQGADIIGMTTTGAAKYRKILQDIRPKIVVVEEAAEVLEAHIITTLSSGCQHLILIGDHQQLRPSAAVYELARNFNLEVSMFERLIRMNVPYIRLDYQHRMRPEIAQLLTPHIYDKLENDSSVYEYDSIKGVGGNLFFVDHNHLEEQIHEGKSRQNIHEAAFVRCLCLYFIHQGYDPSQITVLTTYTGQLHCLQKMMPKSKFEGVRLCVVDKYQGEENEIIILSLVRSNLEGQVGFLKIPNRVCVALSRAKRGLFCIGNMQMLSNIPLWSKINDVLKANGQIGRELKLQCENHPNTLSYVSTSEDFSNVPEGGCTIPCEYRLNCGHVCTLLCHPYDPEHKKFICNKPCPKVMCINGH